ncbi:unnamed protein product [Vitrella brassicaformis CCMP3155]|uniref:alanine--glyoxylate transaminase n=2 Tax=Vitrella brassicaformis TaxID=1169539 RepID=A0A0G4GGV9_VITBC|nr:unnamed protein product [Vitrella brassicaformis CCMP3155]|mmetsp:Transcript_11657/g.33947  ORF Transcript_11657/g.33947 Transcript_11657/m.33947 type:complete len:484 (+) Transcript_11657:154-1605(+)|eukprot:CEM28848.1 unnamed protein product [Vitrella brassicaformis CCMP3155]
MNFVTSQCTRRSPLRACARWVSTTAEVDELVTPHPRYLPDIEYTQPKYRGPSKEEILSLRQTHHGHVFHYYRMPVMITDGHMQYLFDEERRRYLDLFGGIVTVSVGHCHPEIVKAGESQMRKLMHTTHVYLNPEMALYAKELTDKFPGHLKSAFFVNSGSEANELAILLARVYTGNYDMIALRNSYHGASYLTMGAGGMHTWKYNLPMGFGFHHAANPNIYRSVVPKREAADFYAADVMDIIKGATPGRLAGYIHETIQGVGGAVMYPDGYLKMVYEMVREHGGLCIADEVQTGFGRTGTHYWGFETQGVTPDIVTMAKGIGNGFPLGAVVTTPEIMEAVSRKLFFNTFGGNPVASAIGRAVLRVIDDENLQAHSANVGTFLKTQLTKLKEKYEIIGDVRGRGLMVGIEFVKDRETKEPAKTETMELHEMLKNRGVLVGKGGLYGNVFRIKPPMCVTVEDMEYFVYHLEQAIRQLTGLSVTGL